VGTQSNVTLSADQACDWTQVLTSPASPKVSYFDFTVATTGSHSLLLVATTFQPTGPVNQLQESTDNGRTWKTIGAPLPAAVVNTIDIDPTNAMHIYATGLTVADETPNSGVFMSSTDHGATWTSHPILNTFAWSSPYIAAVHPTDPNKVFVRTDGWKDRSNIQTADDSLLYTSDGGKTWTEILHAGGPADSSPGAKLFGFALSPDGSTVLAGYGDPVDGSRLVEPMWFGVYKSSSDGKYSFGADPANPTPMLGVEPISCITWTANGIYVCMSPQGESSFVAFAKQPMFASRKDMTVLMTLSETKAAPPSCAGRAATTCDWAMACPLLNACDGGAPKTCPPLLTTTTTSTTTTGGGSTGTGGAGGTHGGGNDSKPSGCGCRAPGSGPKGGAVTLAWLAGAAMLVRRRRARLARVID
jgi:MYXO-CTERM domain-containing protein